MGGTTRTGDGPSLKELTRLAGAQARNPQDEPRNRGSWAWKAEGEPGSNGTTCEGRRVQAEDRARRRPEQMGRSAERSAVFLVSDHRGSSAPNPRRPQELFPQQPAEGACAPASHRGQGAGSGLGAS